MVGCFAPHCSHRNERDSCQFFSFPKNSKEAAKWLRAIRRDDTTQSAASRVCSCHFVDMKKENGPSIFQWNVEKKVHFLTPEKRTRKKRKPVAKNIEPEPDLSSSSPPLQLGNNSDPDNSDCILGQITTSLADLHCHAETQTLSKHIVHAATQTTNIQKKLKEHIHEQCDAETQTLSAHIVHVACQTTNIPKKLEQCMLESQVEELTSEVKSLKQRCFGFFRIDSDSLCRCYTGLNLDAFHAIAKLISGIKFQYIEGWNVQRLCLDDQLLMTLMKLRQGCKNKDLACRFGVSTATVHNIINTFLIVLHKCVYEVTMNKIPNRSRTKKSLPKSFQEIYDNCRIIIDCTEIRCAVPHKLSEQKSTFSNYKKYHSFKSLVGVAPNGALVYVSDLYPGNTSDKAIVEHSKILDEMEPGDLILADKGFLINNIAPLGVSVNIPPFAPPCGQQFSPEEIAESENIASRRIHVERIIQRIKTFKILNFIPKKYFEMSSIIFQVCAALVNFQNPILDECKKYFQT